VVAIVAVVVAIVAALIALASARYTKRQAEASEASLTLERERRLEERRPKLLGKIETVDEGGSYRLCLVVESGPRLQGMDVSIPKGQDVAFSRGVLGVYRVPSSTDVPLRAFTYDTRGNRVGILPGHPAIWKIDFGKHRDPKIPVRIVVNCQGENGENWEEVLTARLEGSLTSPVFDDRG
jgi:hypothetical protein